MRAIMPDRDRLISALGVALIHAMLGWLLLAGLAPHLMSREQPALSLFTPLPPTPPSTPPAESPRQAAPERAAPEGAAALHARPTAIVSPLPVIVLPVPVIAAPVATDGAAPRAGATEVPGPGTGAGTSGNGLGAGGAGEGSGGGGSGKRARHLSGSIENRDYPVAASRTGARGRVEIAFTVETSGRVTGCSVSRSSGNAALDDATCRLATQRFRYAPARDAAGRPVAERRGWRQDWWFE